MTPYAAEIEAIYARTVASREEYYAHPFAHCLLPRCVNLRRADDGVCRIHRRYRDTQNAKERAKRRMA